MNLICNNCASGFVYQKLGIEYNNPFMWNLISVDSFTRLICNWDQLKFTAIKLPSSVPLNGVPMVIDNKVEVKYIHIRYDENAVAPYKKFVDVFCNAPWEYAVNKYYARLRRMRMAGELPIFLIADDHTNKTVDTVRPDNSIKLIETLNGFRIPHKIIWATQHIINEDAFPQLNLTIIHPSNQYVGTVADEIIAANILGITRKHRS